ncbi:hypothetical protein QCA50_000169 [Cerrena zonata]|uniref:Zona occludens toxin N-terminal domain-containing protein n=1 Tax=Cerrena zonata TaxID=2478898 RepID=A0AAW0GPK6_9APHY
MPARTDFVRSSHTIGPALEELDLLNHTALESSDRTDHELYTAPILTRGAFLAGGFSGKSSQYGVLGGVVTVYDQKKKDVPDDPRIYVNTNAPFSALVCGVQGSGKSHTVSVMLENMFIPRFPAIGSLEKPLSGLVLHFGEGGANSRPCEAAWVGVSAHQGANAPPVRVYVSKSSLQTMRGIYSELGSNVTVEPLMFAESELDAEAFLSMMSVGSSETAPLYVQMILSILRELGENYSYSAFQKQLKEAKKSFSPQQLSGLEQRMTLLQAFIAPKGYKQKPRFSPGQLTIVDLSDPFIDPAAACGLFEIITRLFVRANVDTGKVLVVDEAHKYLCASKTNVGLTKALLSLIRQQRHLAMRVIISTQEPTVVPPVLLDLCSVAILHRFASPSWWEHISQHVSAQLGSDEAFNHVVTLRTGEAIILAPSGLAMIKEATGSEGAKPHRRVLQQLGRRYILMKTRKRVTADGGASIMVL